MMRKRRRTTIDCHAITPPHPSPHHHPPRNHGASHQPRELRQGGCNEDLLSWGGGSDLPMGDVCMMRKRRHSITIDCHAAPSHPIPHHHPPRNSTTRFISCCESICKSSSSRCFLTNMGDLLLSQKIVHTHYSDLERNHRVVGSGTLLRWVVLCSESIRESLSSVLTNVDARHPPGGRSSTPHTDFELSRGSVVEHSLTR